MGTNISLTDFVDFSIRNGTSRLTKLKEIKSRKDYHPGLDYWKGMRDGLENFHKNKRNIDFLSSIVDESHPSKKVNYQQVIDRYKSFLGRKNIEWFTPSKDKWIYNNLNITVNPELGLVINDVPHLIKIYFKENPSQPNTLLDKRKLETIFFLMEDTLNHNYEQEINYSVLNAKTGKLITKNKSFINIREILESDALAFNHLWENI
ncbi:hypothetical protein [Metabacillus idriensis]|uniref:hypothetical protein n=1 Tax=Metabacillus idriensis TaxID=324768 RepID=UPI00174BA24A|nr:hypothetical protein [Metabacillus idriensis]